MRRSKAFEDRFKKKASELGFELDDEDEGYWLKFDTTHANGLELSVNLATRAVDIYYHPEDLRTTLDIDDFFAMKKITVRSFLVLDNKVVVPTNREGET